MDAPYGEPADQNPMPEGAQTTGPQVVDNSFTERAGIIAVDSAVNVARSIWRETPTRDVGIDGQIEYVSAEGIATGRLVAVQVKAGSSYFSGASANEVPFTADGKHREYWANHPIPVILVLHNPDDGELIWLDARAALRHGNEGLRIPRAQVFDTDGILSALSSGGPLPVGAVDPSEVVRLMINAAHTNPRFNVSYFDLFFQGLTDIAHSLYFGMDLAWEIQDFKAALPGADGQIEVGQAEHEFFDGYVNFLIAHDLARVDFDAWYRMKERFSMLATFLCPLTAKGEAVVSLVSSKDQELGGAGGAYVVAQERSVGMDFRHFCDRSKRIEMFKSTWPQ